MNKLITVVATVIKLFHHKESNGLGGENCKRLWREVYVLFIALCRSILRAATMILIFPIFSFLSLNKEVLFNSSPDIIKAKKEKWRLETIQQSSLMEFDCKASSIKFPTFLSSIAIVDLYWHLEWKNLNKNEKIEQKMQWKICRLSNTRQSRKYPQQQFRRRRYEFYNVLEFIIRYILSIG